MLAATLSDTVPLPVPLAPAVTVIHEALLVAVRAQPVVPVTVTLTALPAATTLVLVDDSVNATQVAAAWVTVNVTPAIVTVPVRELAVVLVATLRDTVPLPVPLAPDVTLIHDALLVADRAQPVVPVTVTLTPPPTAATLVLVDDSEKAPHAAAACVTVKAFPATVSVPVREVPAVLAATL